MFKNSNRILAKKPQKYRLGSWKPTYCVYFSVQLLQKNYCSSTNQVSQGHRVGMAADSWLSRPRAPVYLFWFIPTS